MVTLGSDAGSLLESFSEAMEAPAYLVNPRGRMVVGSAPELWERLEPKPALRSTSMETMEDDERLYSVSGVPVQDLSEGTAGLLVTIRDATGPLSRLQTIDRVTLAAGLGFLLLTALGLHLYLRSSFRPLERAIDTLNALGRQEQQSGSPRPAATRSIASAWPSGSCGAVCRA
ncbi:hypothetical protein [Fodinicurvata halophila]|uniref:hypothetical protein n=1 Tax=Fodinicurvata halophila TaxID=1419723 RepID=UPI003641625F